MSASLIQASPAERWLGVEVRHLAALRAIAEEHSFRGAADRLGYVQSAVSQQLSRLEKLVGSRLVERTRGHSQVELTEAGRLLLRHSEQILGQLDAARTDLDRLEQGEGGRLRVGLLSCVARRIMPSLLADLATAAPGIAVSSREGPEAELLAAVEQGALDAAFCELPLPSGPFEHRELILDPCLLVVRVDSELAGTGPVDLADLASTPLVARPRWRTAERIEARLRSAGLEPEYRCEADSDAAAQALAGAGLAAAILPRLAIDEGDPETVALQLEPALPARTLALVWHRDRVPSAALKTFFAPAASAFERLDWRHRRPRATLAA